MANNNCNPIQKPTGTITSFTRNHYFYGKLLTVSDFQLEQDYFIDKIRLKNQLLEGMGIIDGLEIIDLDLTSDPENIKFKLTAGHAIDTDGNMILVNNTPVIEILNNATDKANFYICIEYEECQQDSVPIASDDSQCEDEECCYNRVRETYKVTIEDSASACVHATTCTSESEVDTKSIVLAVVKNSSIDASETKEYRCTIKSNQMLQGILCNHLDTINPHQIKHNDLPDMNGIDASSSNTTKNKHVSNNDAQKWNSAIYFINNKKPDTNGNLAIEAGDNIAITSNANTITITSEGGGGDYFEKNYSLNPGSEPITIKHNFGKYPNVDIYKVIKENVYTKEDIAEVAKSENKDEATVKEEIGAKTIDDVARDYGLSHTGNTKSRIDNLRKKTKKPLVLSSRAKRVSVGDNILFIVSKPRERIIKIVGEWNNVHVEVEHKNKNVVKITNLNKDKITIKAILTA